MSDDVDRCGYFTGETVPPGCKRLVAERDALKAQLALTFKEDVKMATLKEQELLIDRYKRALTLHEAEHWTDPHIRFIDESGKWTAYDEAGLTHGVYDTRDDARDALVVYAATTLRKYR